MGAYSSAVLALSPGQFLEFQEPSGATATDISGNGRNGSYNGSFSYHQGSLLNSEPAAFSVGFSGAEDVQTTYLGWSGSVTATGWAYRNNISQGMALTGTINAVGQDVLFRADSGATSASFWPDVSAGSVTWAAGAIPTATAFHWALTYVNPSFTAELFINGISLGTKVLGSGFNTPGNVNYGDWTTFFWIGRMSHVAFFPTALTAPQIFHLWDVGFNGAPGPADNAPHRILGGSGW